MQRAEDRQLAIPAIKEQFSLRTDRTIGMQSVPLYELDATAGLVALFDGTTRQVRSAICKFPICRHATGHYMFAETLCIRF